MHFSLETIIYVLSVVWNIPNCPDSILFSLSAFFRFYSFIIPWNTQEKILHFYAFRTSNMVRKIRKNDKLKSIHYQLIIIYCFRLILRQNLSLFCHLSQTQKIKITNKYTISRQEELTCEWRKFQFWKYIFYYIDFSEGERRESGERIFWERMIYFGMRRLKKTRNAHCFKNFMK